MTKKITLKAIPEHKIEITVEEPVARHIPNAITVVTPLGKLDLRFAYRGNKPKTPSALTLSYVTEKEGWEGDISFDFGTFRERQWERHPEDYVLPPPRKEADGYPFYTSIKPVNKKCFNHKWTFWEQEPRSWKIKICEVCGEFKLYEQNGIREKGWTRYLTPQQLSMLLSAKRFCTQWHDVNYQKEAFPGMEEKTNFSIHDEEQIKQNAPMIKIYSLYQLVKKWK